MGVALTKVRAPLSPTVSGVVARRLVGNSAFVLGERMADICRATLGPDAYLFNDQYVVKGLKVRPAARGTRTPATSPTRTRLT